MESPTHTQLTNQALIEFLRYHASEEFRTPNDKFLAREMAETFATIGEVQFVRLTRVLIDLSNEYHLNLRANVENKLLKLRTAKLEANELGAVPDEAC